MAVPDEHWQRQRGADAPTCSACGRPIPRDPLTPPESQFYPYVFWVRSGVPARAGVTCDPCKDSPPVKCARKTG